MGGKLIGWLIKTIIGRTTFGILLAGGIGYGAYSLYSLGKSVGCDASAVELVEFWRNQYQEEKSRNSEIMELLRAASKSSAERAASAERLEQELQQLLTLRPSDDCVLTSDELLNLRRRVEATSRRGG